MGFRYGIVGLPNIRKSILFSAPTKAGTEAANFPFCTIESNVGVAPMPDPRLDQLAEIVKPQRALPTTIESVDTTDLVKGTSKGEGLGNQFLTSICETEAIGHVVRHFENNNIIHVSGKVNPADNIEAINTELVLVDLDTCKCAIHRVQKKAKDGDKDAKVELAALEKYPPQLENVGMLCALDLSTGEKTAVYYLSFLTLKPIMYIANVSEDGFENNPYPDQVCEIAAKEGSVVVPVCVAVETGIAELNDEKRGEFMQELGLEEPGLNHVIRVGYKLLNLQTYFIAGVEEVHAWIVPVGATVPQTADEIHTDFEKGFIRAQTAPFKDFITYRGEQDVKEAGKVRAEGKDYIVKDGDTMNFPFSA